MRLLARIIEGNNAETFVIEEEFDQSRFNNLYFLGLCLWNQEAISKYEIAVFDDNNKLVWNYRPDKSNFERNDYNHDFIVSVLNQVNLLKQPNHDNLLRYLTMIEPLWKTALSIRDNQIMEASMKEVER